MYSKSLQPLHYPLQPLPDRYQIQCRRRQSPVRSIVGRGGGGGGGYLDVMEQSPLPPQSIPLPSADINARMNHAA